MNIRLCATLFFLLITSLPGGARAGVGLSQDYYLVLGWKRYQFVQVDELANDYFESKNNSRAYYYKIARLGLKDTLGVRRKMVNLFKTAYMDKHEDIDLSKWMALNNHRGYCFTASDAGDNENTMAMDVVSKDGYVRGVIVGSVPSCKNAKIDNEFVHKFPPPKKANGVGGGC